LSHLAESLNDWRRNFSSPLTAGKLPKKHFAPQNTQCHVV
jgi:hypothetical protein